MLMPQKLFYKYCLGLDKQEQAEFKAELEREIEEEEIEQQVEPGSEEEGRIGATGSGNLSS
jgi:hypothetical protein